MIKQKSGFEYKFNAAANEMTVCITGEVDHHGAVSIRGDIDRLIFERRPSRLIMDLSRVDFMDSSGLGLIMGRYSVMSKLGGQMLLLDPCPRVSKIIALSGLDRMIKIKRSSYDVEKGRREKRK